MQKYVLHLIKINSDGFEGTIMETNGQVCSEVP